MAASLREYCIQYIHWNFVLMDLTYSYTAELQRMELHSKILTLLLGDYESSPAAIEITAILHNLDKEIGLPVDVPDLEAWERETKKYGNLLYKRLTQS